MKVLYYFKEYQKYAQITGYQNINFCKAENFLKRNRTELQQSVWIQFFNANLIATHNHLYFAVLNSLQALKNKTNISKNLAMETMLYASAQRQIKRAIDILGIKQEYLDMAVIIIGEDKKETQNVLEKISVYLDAKQDESVLEMSDLKSNKIKEAFKVREETLQTVIKNNDHEEALVNLVIEKVALLATQL
jgi:tRNA threonylcarbamoyladenosine modification (KEOPS) complex Cgi121 subunit